mmetsp:Transcript_46797/g.53977  ORF Transcript_46797/g.53977 Transcript_46797/m.53977 type:complete len:140 (-) Transcript_46797:175-594(-)
MRKALFRAPSFKSTLFLNPILTRYFSQTDMSVIMTDKCIEMMRTKQEVNQQRLRLTVLGGEGCEGFTYHFAFDSTQNDDDICIEKNGAELLIDEMSLDLVKGSTLDYEDELIRQGFAITDNPNAEKGCGCGVSFSLKDE